MFKRFIKDASGATAIEYALMASLIGAAIVGSVTVLGSATEDNYDQISQDYQNAGG